MQSSVSHLTVVSIVESFIFCVVDCVFLKAHRKGADGPYTGPWAEQTMYEEFLQQATQANSESDSSSTPVDHNALFLEVVSPPQKGRTYGVRSQVPVESSTHATSYNRPITTKQELDEAVTRAFAPLQEELQKHDELIRALEEQVQMLQSQIQVLQNVTSKLATSPAK